MDDAPPPTDHVLRPHHVDLLTILVFAFKEPECKDIPPAFLLHLYRTLLNEISEVNCRTIALDIYLNGSIQVSRPQSHYDLMKTVCSGPNADSEKSQRVIAAIKAVVRH